MNVGWIWERPVSDPRYLTNVNVNWTQISKAVARLNARKRKLNVGLLNFNISEINSWQQLLPRAEILTLHLDYVKANITWDDLYPEWIDEEEENEVPACADLPDPMPTKTTPFDLIVVKLPCNRTAKNWSRDVARFHLQVAAAKLASQSTVAVILITECFPIPNLFSCKNLLVREGNVWLYNPDPRNLREKLQLPVGSCKLAVPLKADGNFYVFLILTCRDNNNMLFVDKILDMLISNV